MHYLGLVDFSLKILMTFFFSCTIYGNLKMSISIANCNMIISLEEDYHNLFHCSCFSNFKKSFWLFELYLKKGCFRFKSGSPQKLKHFLICFNYLIREKTCSSLIFQHCNLKYWYYVVSESY